jgi:hypothetical protein
MLVIEERGALDRCRLVHRHSIRNENSSNRNIRGEEQVKKQCPNTVLPDVPRCSQHHSISVSCLSDGSSVKKYVYGALVK